MRAPVLILSVLSLGLPALAQEESEAIRPTDIGADLLGKTVSVEGRVYSTAKTGAGIHLYFGADTSTAFQAIVTSKNLHKFEVDVVKKYNRRNVQVDGKVEEEQGKFFIRINEPSQIKVVPRKRGTS